MPESGTPLPLDIARFLAPLIIPYAALVALLAALGIRAERLRMRLLGHRHILIIGAGARGAMLTRSLARDRRHYNVVVLEYDDTNGTAISLRRAGVPVVYGDARSGDTVAAVRPERAEQIVLVAGDDSVNLEILAAIRRHVGEREAAPIHVTIDEQTLWSKLYSLPFERVRSPRSVEFLNFPDRAARLLTAAAFEGRERRDGRRILIHGDGPDMARTAVQALRSPAVGAQPTIVLEGPGAEQAVRALMLADRWVTGAAPAAAMPGQVSDARSDPTARASVIVSDGIEPVEGVTEGFVCGLSEAQAISAAVSVRERAPGQAAIYVATPDEDAHATLEEIGVDLSRLRMIPTLSRVFGPGLFEKAALEWIARARHAEYLARSRERGDDPNDRANQPWERLDPETKEQNYDYARDITDLLTTIGIRVVPLTGAEIGGELPLTKKTRDYLKIREHNRWWRLKCSQGVIYGPDTSPSGVEPKTNKFMRAFGSLDDNAKAKDSDSVEILPRSSPISASRSTRPRRQRSRRRSRRCWPPRRPGARRIRGSAAPNPPALSAPTRRVRSSAHHRVRSALPLVAELVDGSLERLAFAPYRVVDRELCRAVAADAFRCRRLRRGSFSLGIVRPNESERPLVMCSSSDSSVIRTFSTLR